jgi:hypothetical protein
MFLIILILNINSILYLVRIRRIIWNIYFNDFSSWYYLEKSEIFVTIILNIGKTQYNIKWGWIELFLNLSMIIYI